MFPAGVRRAAVSNITPWQECSEKTEKIGRNKESTSRVADLGTDMGEVEAEEVEKMENE